MSPTGVLFGSAARVLFYTRIQRKIVDFPVDGIQPLDCLYKYRAAREGNISIPIDSSKKQASERR